jgi:ABC-2 type transport system ATP-binding protein
VSVEGVSKRYSDGLWKPGKHALHGVDLVVRRGIAFGLIGPNGAGKTTLLKILLGVVRPSAGRVRVLGADPGDTATRMRIGYLPERLHLPVAWTARAFLESVARFKRVRAIGADWERQLSRVGLLSERDVKIRAFSKGMRQRLGLAAALLGQPDLLVLDEPTDGIDPKGRVEIRNVLAEECARGATLFLNSHLLAETERVCDDVGIMVGGRVLRIGALAELGRDPARWTASFAPGADAQRLAGLGFEPTDEPDRFACSNCDAAELNRRLTRARDSGALLVELAPAVRDLESLLLQLLDEHA